MPDAELLEETSRALGAKTYPAAVNQALAEAIRIKKLGALRQFWGAESGLGNWPISNKITLALNNWERKAGGGDPGGYVRLDWKHRDYRAIAAITALEVAEYDQ